jgi:hypothetical protein
LIPEKPRQPLATIEGSTPVKTFIPKDRIPNLFVEDINAVHKFVSKRVVDPLKPEYHLPEDEEVYGYIEKSKPN